jgi:hypothetical protein
MAIGAPPKAFKPECAARGRAIPLAFVGLNPAAAKRDWYDMRTGKQQAARGARGLAVYHDAVERVFPHVRKPF